jgi:polar amino acid transport system substrate-binding protein
MRTAFPLAARAALLVLASALALAASVSSVRAEDLALYYFERPPYYQTLDGRPSGFLLEWAMAVFDDAEVGYHYESVPPGRILQRIREGESACSVGWFKTPGRQAYARFTQPVYRDRPLVVLFTDDNVLPMAGHADLESLLRDGSLTLGLVRGFSYGPYVDAMIGRLAPRAVRVVAGQDQMVAMLAQGRFDYMFASGEEAEQLVRWPGAAPGRLRYRTLKDVPQGNERHIMCSKRVPAEVVEALDRAIGRAGVPLAP